MSGPTVWKPTLLQILEWVATEHTHTHTYPPNLTAVKPLLNFQGLKHLRLAGSFVSHYSQMAVTEEAESPIRGPWFGLTADGWGSSYLMERFTVTFSSLSYMLNA